MQMVVFTQTQALDNGREVNGASHLTVWAGRWTEAGWFLAVRVCGFRSSACDTCKYGSRPGGSLSARFSSGNDSVGWSSPSCCGTQSTEKGVPPQMYRTSCCHSFIFHKWINTVADHPPCPSKTLHILFCSVILKTHSALSF